MSEDSNNSTSTDSGAGASSGSGRNKFADRAWAKVDSKGKELGERAGNKAERAIELGKQAVNSGKEVGKTANATFGQNTGKAGKAAGSAAQAVGRGKDSSGGGASQVKNALNKKEGESNNAKPSKTIEAGEATGKTAVRLAGGLYAAGSLAYGNVEEAGRVGKNLAKQFIDNPTKFLSDTKKGMLVIIGIGSITLVSMVAMFVFIASFAVMHFSETAKEAALSLTLADEAVTVGRAVVTGVGNAAGAVSDALFGIEDTELAGQLVTATASQSNQLVRLADEESTEEETEISRLVDQLDFEKILTNLGEQGLMTVKSGEEEIPFNELSSRALANYTIVVGNKEIAVPEDPTNAEFVKELGLAIRETDLFAHQSRVRLSKEMKNMYTDTGVELWRWEGNGEEVTDYGKNIKSAFTAVSKNNTDTEDTDLEDVDDAGDEVMNSAEELLDENPSAAVKNYPTLATNKAWRSATNGQYESVEEFAETARASDSPALFAITSYCSASSYVDNRVYEKIITQQYNGAMRNALKVFSSSDQIEVGNVRRQTVSGESQRREGYETSRSYLKSIGSDVSSRTPDLNESQLAFQDPLIVYKAMSAIVALFERPFDNGGFVDLVIESLGGGGGGFVDSIRGFVGDIAGVVSGVLDRSIRILGGENLLGQIGELLCVGVSNDQAQVAIRIADTFTQAPGELAQSGVLTAVQQSLEQSGATVLSTQLGLGEGSNSKPTAGMISFIFDSHKALNYAGLDDGVDLASKEFEGGAAFGNEMSRAGGGRPLNQPECTAARINAGSELAYLRRQKPLLARLFSPTQHRSPTALALAHVPVSTGGVVQKTKTALSNGLNPLGSIAASTQKIAYAATLQDNKAYALSTSNFAEDRQLCFGYSQSEKQTISDDPTFWPLKNAAIVEADPDTYIAPFEDCYDKSMPELMFTGLSNDAGDVSIDSESINIYGGKCRSEALSSTEALRYRVYRGDKFQLASLVDMQEITEDSAVGPGGDQPEGVVGIEETVVTNGCGGIRVHTSIVSQVEALCVAASGDGLDLTGGGWRDNQTQISLREQHGCGGARIYDRSCTGSPPTAVPGRSMHERGLAIDFNNCSSRSTACHQWLKTNAVRFGLINLPSEPWHWSTTGN